MQNTLFSTLVVRAYLQTPVISDKYLPLDGILFNQMIRDNFGQKVFTKSRSNSAKIYSGKYLPLLKRNDQSKNEWYYACSFAVWSPDTTRGISEYAKRFDTNLAVSCIDFGKKRGRVDTARGDNKNYFIKEYTFNSPYVEWYCRGIKSELEMLLKFCTHIGKKSAQGFGSVLNWTVEETERDWYKNDNSGKVMRAIPSNKGIAIYGIRPSYWHQDHQFKVILPE
jgi:CRISPR type IV-associated protein Csf3